MSATTAEQTTELAKELIELSNAHRGVEAVDRLYDEKVVSIEPQGNDAMPARMEGIEAIRGKNTWWYDHHEVHESKATGPFCGHREDQFAVIFDIDVTFKPTGQRSQMSEVALYTVRNGKVVQEEFLYRVR
jgi:SnoaL-like domain